MVRLISRLSILFLALVGLLAGITTSASATNTPAVPNVVGAHALALDPLVGPSPDVSLTTHLETTIPHAKNAVATGVAAKYGDGAIEGIGEARTYVNLTKGGSIRNVGTNTTHTEFSETLTRGGWISRTSKDGAVQIFQRDGAKYVLRSKNSSGYQGWTADVTAAGSTGHTLEIRLEYVP